MCTGSPDSYCRLMYEYPYITTVFTKAELTALPRPEGLPAEFPHPLPEDIY